MIKLSLEEFVLQFGSERQKENYWKIKPNKKGLRNINIDVFNSIMKVAETKYQKVDVTGKGAKREIILTGKYEVVQKKEDHRAGRKMPSQLPFNRDNEIAFMVYEYLKTIGAGTTRYFTGLSLAQKSLIITEREKQLADAMFNDDLFDTIVNTLVNEGHLPSHYHSSILKDHVMRDTRPVKEYIKTALKELERSNLISYGNQPMVMIEEDGEKRVVTIGIEDYQRFLDKETELLNQYGLSRQDLTWKNKTEKVKSFNRVWREEMKTIPYKIETINHIYDKDATVIRGGVKTKGAYIPCKPYNKEYTGVIRLWEGFWVTIKASDKDIEKFIKKNEKLNNLNAANDIYKKRVEYIHERAVIRETNFVDKKRETFELDFLNTSLFDEEMDQSNFEETVEQSYISIKDMKRDKIYSPVSLSLAKGLMKEERFEKE